MTNPRVFSSGTHPTIKQLFWRSSITREEERRFHENVYRLLWTQ